MSSNVHAAERPSRAPCRSPVLGDDGAVAVEFALVLPVLVLLIYMIFEIGRGLWTHNVLQLAVEEASRYAAANPTATASQITGVAETMAAVLNGAAITFSVTTETGPSPKVTYVTVAANHTFQPLFPLLPALNGGTSLTEVPMTASARMPVLE